MQTICVKIDEDVYQELEKRRGTETKSVYYRKLIDSYLNMGVYQDLQKVYNELKTEYDKLLAIQESQKTEYVQKTEYDKLLAIQEIQKARIADLERSSGFYIQEVEAWKRLSEKVLYPSQEEQKRNPWWQFWKK
jgi:hypothetical protein